MEELFFRLDPIAPWSAEGYGLIGLVAVGLALVLLTLWTYTGHAQATRKRLAIVLVLRLLALLTLLLTTLRPTVGYQEIPKVPSTLLIGVDVSESMTVPDELNNSTRWQAVTAQLRDCEPLLQRLRDEQNTNIQIYRFGRSNFEERDPPYDPQLPPKDPQSDYAIFLKKLNERWQAEPYIRGVVMIGDGTDNGGTRPEAEAARWRQAGRQVQTFAVGSATTDSGTKDVALTSLNVLSGNSDGSVFVKTDVSLQVLANAFGFVGAKVPVKVFVDENTGQGYVLQTTENTTLSKETDNRIELKFKAPERAGEIKVKVEIPVASTDGDVVPSNNIIETYLSVTKEGMRVLVINRENFEQTFLRRALQRDQRIDQFQVIRQTSEPATAKEREGLDFDRQAYDVIVIGNISGKQLTTLDPTLPAKIRDQVTKRGVGLMFIGGHATFTGTPNMPDATGWQGVREIEDILPIDLNQTTTANPSIFTSDRARIQYLPTAQQADYYLNRLGNSPAESLNLWRKLNDPGERARFSGLSRMGTPKSTATVYAVASDNPTVEAIPVLQANESKFAPLLVGHQIGVGNRGRVLAFAAMDTSLWQKLGQPQSNQGVELYGQYWRQLIRWLAHQDEETGQVFARPELPRLPVGGRQTIRIGVRQPGGTPALEPQFSVKILAPGEAEATAADRAYQPDSEGRFRVNFEPTVPGEYQIKVVGRGKDAKGEAITGEATARFFAYPVASDEMLIKAARPEVLQRIATAGGGQFHRLEDLPNYFKSLLAKPMEVAKPRPKFYPDWRRDSSQGFLPAWLVLFVALLGTEWLLRRSWGLV
ncbi:MAG: hypothetical protein ACRC8S_05690 [Fimbriiglobus sp.]